MFQAVLSIHDEILLIATIEMTDGVAPILEEIIEQRAIQLILLDSLARFVGQV